MRKVLVIFFTLISVISSAQILDPVSWIFTQNQLSDTEVELQFKATIESPWHMYSQFISEEATATATEFRFFNKEGFEFIESVIEEGAVEKFDPVNAMVLKFFEGKAIFTQKIKVITDKEFKLEGDIYFGVCDDSKCLFPETVEFSFIIKGLEEVVIDEALVITEKEAATPVEDKEGLKEENSSEKSSNKGMWYLFFIAFLSGFAALLTPCVFPMIPMTVAFFTKQSKTKAQGITNAIIYGLSIIVIYVALGVGVSSVFGADTLNNMATNIYFNIGFFLLLIIFGVSFLGAFEIELPSSWTNKSVEAEGKGGLIGIFFMAFTLALVSFSCTGPIVGTLLVKAATGTEGYLGPIIGMLGFSLAIALPFALFAAFPGWLNSLPKSGGWLNSIKVTLGFLEIALAFKFLSTADLVMQTHWLERELFIAIWIIIFGLLTMYLLGFLKFAHDSDLPYISVGRLSVAILTGTLTVYMIPGLWGAPLKLISGLPPPMQYSESPYGVGDSRGGAAVAAVHKEEEQHLGPQGILAFHDYNEGVAYAKKIGKPIFLDFTGHGCQNCRKMEEYVWSDPNIKSMLSNDVVLISLYVDERIKLPKPEQYEVTMAGKTKKVKTTGDKWMVLQANKYGTNSQPFYVFLDHDERQMVEPANYQDYGNVELFTDWLKRGLEQFNK